MSKAVKESELWVSATFCRMPEPAVSLPDWSGIDRGLHLAHALPCCSVLVSILAGILPGRDGYSCSWKSRGRAAACARRHRPRAWSGRKSRVRMLTSRGGTCTMLALAVREDTGGGGSCHSLGEGRV